MPKSKRNKQIELAKTKKRGLDWKKRLYEEVQNCVDKYENVFIFSVNDMRNNKMKNVREQWKHSRFFIGKNKIMAMALGRSKEEEYKPNLHKLGQQIKGQRGLLFSNKPVEEVLSWFRSYTEGDFARSGNTATETVQLPAGPLTMFPHNLEPYLRELGLPTTLERGVIHLIKDHEICKAGDILTPETAKILKLLGYEMAEFHVTIDCIWSKDGTFQQLTECIDTDTAKNKQKKKSSFSTEGIIHTKPVEYEQMEVELSAEEESFDDDDDEEEKEVVAVNDTSNTPDVTHSTVIAATSTPKVKSNGVSENAVSDLKEKSNKSALECNQEEVSEKTEDIEEISEEFEEKNAVDDKNDKNGIGEKIDEPSDIKEEIAPTSKRGRPQIATKTPKTAKKIQNSKRESLPKTPDANTSQDSPVFRELRNRSVKFSRKKK